MSYDNTNTGVLFRNEKKQTEKHPDYTGSIDIDGREYWLSGWLNESAGGKKYQKLSVALKESKKPEPVAEPIPDDDLPF